MDHSLICFIILSSHEAAYQACISNLSTLVIPPGMRVQYMRIGGFDGNNYAAACQAGMSNSNAKYKIYMDEKVIVINPNLLSTMISLFHLDESLGILGVLDYTEVPFSNRYRTQESIGAIIIRTETKDTILHHIHDKNHQTPVSTLSDIILMTQYDIPWRLGLFHSAHFSALSASLEYQRNNYSAAVLPQGTIWCTAPCSDNSTFHSQDELLFRAEYASEISGNFFQISPGRNYHPQIDHQLDNMRTILFRFIHLGKIDHALAAIRNINRYAVPYNQFFRDECIERAYKAISTFLNESYPQDITSYVPDETCVLFYDGICFDTRGLALIYLKALADLRYKIIYVTTEKMKGHLPTIQQLLDRAPVKGESIYLKEGSMTVYSRELCAIAMKYRPARGFLYVDEFEPFARLAFTRLKGCLTRFFINLGDHLYWTGTDAFDICLEFRNWGASISNAYRRIPKEKLLIQPYYPFFKKDTPFKGYPFERCPGDFIIFSGGMLYKTMDASLTYYNTVAWVLDTFPHVKFWYAGTGDDRGLKELMRLFPNRVFHTKERSDLFQIMQAVDMYLNTYPLGGGLMMQYSALAGRPPLTLLSSIQVLDEILLRQDELGICFHTVQEWRKSIYSFIADKNYRTALEAKIRNSVTKEQTFKANLSSILKTGKSKFPAEIRSIDVTSLKKWFFDTFASQWEAGGYSTK